MMNKDILDYRKKHHKCKWCKWYKWHSLEQGHWIVCYASCILKDKVIHFEDFPTICKYYKVKEDDKNGREG